MDIAIILEYIMAVGVGLGCGSFATMVYYRIPNGEVISGRWHDGKRAHCVSCDHQLRTRDLLPVLNWLLTQGKCKFCGYAISPVYFFIEFSCMVLSVLCYMKFGLDDLPLYIMTIGLSACMVVLCATDYTYRQIPDQVLTVAVMLAFLYSSPAQFNDMVLVLVTASLIGLVYTKLYEKLTGNDFVDFGYIKLFALSGFWLPYGQFFIHLVLVIILGLLIRLICLLMKSKKTTPIAISIAPSLLLNVLYDDWWRIFF